MLTLEYWLFGGWAVDFWVGGVTREHDDIDIAAWRDDYDAIGAALVGAGWQYTPVANEVVGTRYRWGRAEAKASSPAEINRSTATQIVQEP